ncbi:GlsB/YeaQ/YmgE family stress response membrane protein [Nocardioides aurantiacus]|uniref:GlsB/YeaQ/YmgE family stress response membrane protein n=1 Tax=Nocardioides aurantiacus TaxID=86796 RepID=UPI00403F1D38
MFNIIGLLVVGLIIGAIARLIKPGRQALGIVGTLLLGVAGALIGGIVASYLGRGDIFELNIIGFIVAVIAAFLLIGVAEAVMGKNRAGARR